MDRLGQHSGPGAPRGGAASVLFVCEGNVCRSPAAELVLRRVLHDAEVHVSSAGTHALVGEAVPPVTARLLAERGVDATGLVARQLTAQMLHEADLVVTMTSLQRRHVVLLDPSVLRRTWTLLSLAESLPTVPQRAPAHARGLRQLSDRAAAYRSTGGDDVPDPYGKGRRTHARVLDMIVPAVAVLADAVRAELHGPGVLDLRQGGPTDRGVRVRPDVTAP